MLRNPWGDFEWNGNWADNSGDWTDDIKRQVGYDDAAGLFWMCYEDVCKYFGRI
jgi:SET domain-containing protein 6